MLRFGLIGSNQRKLNKVAMYMITNHNFVNYVRSSIPLNQYSLYVYPCVNTYEKYERLKDMNFKFIKFTNPDKYYFLESKYIIDFTIDMNKIYREIDKIIEIERMNEMHSVYL